MTHPKQGDGVGRIAVQATGHHHCVQRPGLGRAGRDQSAALIADQSSGPRNVPGRGLLPV